MNKEIKLGYNLNQDELHSRETKQDGNIFRLEGVPSH